MFDFFPQNTLLSSAPFLGNVIFLTVYSKLLDILESRKILGKYYVRRMSIFICSFFSGILLISICFVGCNIIAIIVIMIINVAVCSTAVPGVFANHSDLAPNFSGERIEILFFYLWIQFAYVQNMEKFEAFCPKSQKLF